VRRIPIFLVAVTLVAAACGSSEPVVAEVNGSDVLQAEVLALRTQPEDAVTVNSGPFRNDLNTIILQSIVSDALAEEYGMVVDEGEAAGRLQEELDASGMTVDEAVAALGEDGATEAMLLHNVHSVMLREAAFEALATDAGVIDSALADFPQILDPEVCVRHILVETETELEAVVRRLEIGEEFADVATAASIDTATPGGDLGCSPATRYVLPFAEAAVNAELDALVYPVETEFGYHVLVVYERQFPAAEEFRSAQRELPQEILQNSWITWFNDLVDEADVSISSRVGTWFPEGPGILPPE